MNVYVLLLAGYALISQPDVAVANRSADRGQNSMHSVTSAGPGGEIDKADLRVCCEKIKNQGQHIYFLRDRNGNVKLQVRGIYVHGSALYFQLQLNNRSSRDYAIDGVRFLIMGSNRGRPGTAGPRELEPVYIHDSSTIVPGYTRVESIFVFPRFIMPRGGQLSIDVQEKNGGRRLHVLVTNWILARARLI